MFRHAKTVKTPTTYDGEVRIQKVEKIELVYNLVTKPSVYPKHPTVGPHDVSSGKKSGNIGWGSAPKKGRGIVSIEDINTRSEKFIREKKKQFLG
jgi:hypothetical protein